MKLITYVINSLFLLLCTVAVAMEDAKKNSSVKSKILVRTISQQNVMNMVREGGKREDVSSHGTVRITPVIKVFGCFI